MGGVVAQNAVLKKLLVDAIHQISELISIGQDFARHHEHVCDPDTCVRLQAWRKVFVR